jgi:tetratricopeptide (TPR) repeat protein
LSGDFQGTERFRAKRSLGAGGMGVVYQVFDEEREIDVALKTLSAVGAEDRVGLKNEFRVLADVAHPNLIRLHELFTDDKHCFFTMDLVDGVDFLEHVRIDHAMSFEETVPALSDRFGADDTIRGAVGIDPSTRSGTFRLRTLRDALAQLARGVKAIHEAGLLHRDLKPSNVLVTRSGRVVILDFGLAKDYVPGDSGDAGVFEGTPRYMAPEQILGVSTPATDWYAVGIILYEALTGATPFTGATHDVLWRKRSMDPEPPSSVAANVPEDLDRLCLDLLRSDPVQRPDGAEVLRRLGHSDRRMDSLSGFVPRAPTALVGRDREIDQLRDGFAQAASGQSVFVSVRGAAGIGKSALVFAFARECRVSSGAFTLMGRCHERETVPYKAFDGIVDEISRILDRYAREGCSIPLPPGFSALARLFPVLREIEPSPEAVDHVLDDRELRQTAFRAFWEILERLGTLHPLVVFTDDVHWADADSASLLGELIRRRFSTPMLFIAARRREAERNPFIDVLDELGRASAAGQFRHIEVAPLSTADARQLVLRTMPSASEQVAERISGEAAGSPFFVGQLCRYLESALPDRNDGDISVSTVIQSRLAMLPPAARRVLEIISLSGRPLTTTSVLEASAVDPRTRPLELLQQVHLIVKIPSADRKTDMVTAFHDRIREVVSNETSDHQALTHHRRLAEVLTASRDADHEAIARHFELSGDKENARKHAIAAADRAASALAFTKAAQLYEIALGYGGHAEERRLLNLKLGEALTKAGRGEDAARALLKAAEGAPTREVLGIRRRAAEQLLITGNFARGLVELRAVLTAVGLDYPDNDVSVLAKVLANQTVLRYHPLTYRERSIDAIPEEDLLRIDTCRAVAWPLSMIDLARSALFDARHARLALQAGEPRRIAVALASHATFVSTRGFAARAQTLRLLERARSSAERLDDPYHTALFDLLKALSFTHFSEWKEPLAWIERAERTFAEQCTGVTWELDFARAMVARTLAELGRWKDQAERLRIWLVDARERGDKYFAATLRVFYGHNAWLAADDVERARAELDEAVRIWPSAKFNAQRLSAHVARAQVELYAGEPERAYREMEEVRDNLRASMLQFHEVSSIMFRHTRGCGAVATAEFGRSPRGRRAMLSIATMESKALHGIPTSYTAGAAHLLDAGVAKVQGRAERAERALRQALIALDAAGRAMHSAAARRQLGRLMGGDEGARLVREADDYMTEQGVAFPERVANMLVPGFRV